MVPATTHVTDPLSNWNDQLKTAAGIVGKSKARRAILEAVYRGKKQFKSVHEIRKTTGLTQIRILNEGAKLDGFLLEKVPNGYKKRKELLTRYKRILALAGNKEKLDALPTKTSPKLSSKVNITVAFPAKGKNAKFITIDDINSFSKARNKTASAIAPMAEEKIKQAFKAIIGESGSFKDWGGEKSDLYTTKLRLGSRRVPAAIAFKGKGTKGKKLVPSKMGRNGDQINRLFTEPAEVFLVVYPGQIDSSIISQMQAFAIGNALRGIRVNYGVVDASDLSRLIAAYPKAF
jgi:hypothetical protein